LTTKIIDPMRLAMSEALKALDSIHRLIQQLGGLFLSFSVAFIVSVQLPKADLGATELKATYYQSWNPL
jgi:hypothetical protein